MKIISLGIYLGIGAMLHALFIGAQFDWSSAWTWGWLFGWPIMLFIWFWVAAVLIFIVGLVIALGIGVFEAISERARIRALAEARKKRAAGRFRP